MSRLLVRSLFCLLAATTSQSAQLPQPRLDSVFPAGGQAGTAFLVTIAGGDLDEVQQVRFSHPGIRAVAASADAGGLSFRVSIDPAVPTGVYEIAVGGLFGLSNPRLFSVGDAPEVIEAEPNNDREHANSLPLNAWANGRIQNAGDVDWFEVPARAGQRVLVECEARAIDSALIPHIEVFESGGKRVRHTRAGRSFDAITEWVADSDSRFFVRVADASLRGSAQHGYRLSAHIRPHIDFLLPASAVAATQQPAHVFGRNLPLGEATDLTPPAGLPLQRLAATIIAPRDSTMLDVLGPVSPDQAGMDAFGWRLAGSNPVLIQFADHAPRVEREPNDDAQQAERVTTPTEVCGQFQSRGDVDVFRFAASAGEVFFIEAFGQRNGTTADPWFVIERITKDANGAETIARIGVADDNAANVGGNDFFTASSDPVLQLKVPADGDYQVRLRDRYADSRGHAGLVYRLVIRRPQPDVRLVILPGKTPGAPNQPLEPGSLVLRRGENRELLALALRRDGFGSAIRLTLPSLPPGVRCRPVWLPAGQNQTRLVLEADEFAVVGADELKVVGHAMVEDPAAVAAVAKATQSVAAAADDATRGAAQAALQAAQTSQRRARRHLVRNSRPATIVRTGQNAASVARLTQEALLSVVSGVSPLQLQTSVDIISASPSRQLMVPIRAIRRNGADGEIKITWIGQPAGIEVENKSIAAGSHEGSFRVFLKPDLPPGQYTLVARGQATVPFVRNPALVARALVAQAAAVEQLAVATTALQAAEAKKLAASQELAGLQKQKADSEALVTRLQAAATADAEAAAQAQTRVLDAKKQVERWQRVLTARRAAAVALAQAAAASQNDPDIVSEKQTADRLVAAAESALVESETRVRSAMEAVETATKKVDATRAALQKAMLAAQAVPAKLRTAEQKLAAAAMTAAAAKQRVDQRAAAKTAADQKVKTAQDTNKPQNVSLLAPVPPVVIDVQTSRLQLAAAVPDKGVLGPGKSLEVSLTLKRAGHNGDVRVSLHMPQPAAGVSAEVVTVPAGGNAAKLVVRAAADAAVGVVPNSVVRAEFDDGGPVIVDVPIRIEVKK